MKPGKQWLTGVLLLAACAAVAQHCVTTAPPADAVVLFDGDDASAWVQKGTLEPCQWLVAGGTLTATKSDLQTKQQFGDHILHLEFRVPYMPGHEGQGRGNSGVYMHGIYEIQVLDSYGLEPGTGDCGGIYGQAPPRVNACLPPGTWQSYDILFRAPRYDADGNLAEKALLTVLHNGIMIHDHVATAVTPGGVDRDPKGPGPLMLQYHGSPVSFRNIWVVPLDGEPQEAEEGTR